MNSKTRQALIVLTFGIGFGISADETFYIVKKGDTLSEILADHGLKIYGKNGALVKTLKLNPGLGKTIYPQSKIRLPIAAPVEIHETFKEALPVEKVAPVEIESERRPSDDFEQSFYWRVAPSLSWKALSSTDENSARRSKVNALSDTSYGASVLYGMHFEKGLDIYSRFFLEAVSFAEDGAINLTREKFFAGRFSMGLAYEKSWNLELGMSDELFLTSPSAMNVDIKRVSLPELKVTYLKDIYQYRAALLSCSLTASAFLPRSAPGVDSKFSYGAGAALEAKLNNQAFQIGFDMHQLEAQGNSTNSQNIFWRYSWETR